MATNATTKHENAGSAGILPVFLRAFSYEWILAQEVLAGARYASEAEEASGRLIRMRFHYVKWHGSQTPDAGQ